MENAQNLPIQENADEFVYSRKQKIKNLFSLTTIDGSAYSYFFGCSSNPSCSHSKQWRKTCRNFDSINKLQRDYSYWKILSLVCPLKYKFTTWYCLYPTPAILKCVQRWQLNFFPNWTFPALAAIIKSHSNSRRPFRENAEITYLRTKTGTKISHGILAYIGGM